MTYVYYNIIMSYNYKIVKPDYKFIYIIIYIEELIFLFIKILKNYDISDISYDIYEKN